MISGTILVLKPLDLVVRSRDRMVFSPAERYLVPSTTMDAAKLQLGKKKKKPGIWSLRD